MTRLTNIGNLMHLWMHKVRPGLPTDVPGFWITGAADLLTRYDGYNWLPIVVHEIEKDDEGHEYEVIGNSFVYAAAEAAGLERVWGIVADDSEVAVEISRVLARESPPKINLSTASYDEIAGALEYLITQPSSALRSVKVAVAATRISDAPRETWRNFEPIATLKCGITKGAKLAALETVFYLNPPPLPVIPSLADLKKQTVKALKDLAQLYSLSGYTNKKKADLVALLDSARTTHAES